MRDCRAKLHPVGKYILKCGRDWKGERILKKCVKTNAERLVGGGSRSPGKPGFWQFAKANGQKAALNIIICISVDKIYLKEYFLY